MEAMRVLQQRLLRQALQSRPSTSNATFRQSFRQHSSSRHFTSQQSFRTRPSPLRSTNSTPRTLPRTRLSKPFRRPQSTTTTTSSSHAAADANLSLSGRLKKLSREYGWSALGVYLLLSALDFPFCFLAVKLLGTDRIGHWEHVALSWVKEMVKWPLPEAMGAQVDGAVGGVVGDLGVAVDGGESGDGGEMRLLEVDHGYREAEEAAGREDASLWTQLVLAYAIHKSFIFIRVPLTAAVTPKVVKTLRGWGWNIGKMPKKKGAAGALQGGAGVNTKGSGV